MSLKLKRGQRPVPSGLYCLAGVLLAGVLLMAAGSAGAASIVHPVAGGHVDIDVRLNGVSIGSATGVPITGVSVTADTSALNLEAVEIAIAPNTPISLNQSFGGFNEITVESATLSSTVGFTTLSSAGIPSSYMANAGPLEVNGTWGADDTMGSNPSVSGVPITYDVLAITGIVNSSPFLLIDGVTINSLDGTAFGEPGSNLAIVASYYVITPEPGTGLLAALGLVILGGSRRTSCTA